MAILRQLRYPDFSAHGDIALGERLAKAEADRSVARREPVEAEKRSGDDSAIRAAQFELATRLQVHPVSHCERHCWSTMKCAVLKLKYLAHDYE